MPKDFDMCVEKGGKVKTISLPGGKYMRICKDMNGKMHRGEMKMKKDMKKGMKKEGMGEGMM